MESSEGLPNPRSSSAGKESLLPTASSFSCIPPPYTSNLSHVALGSNGSIIQKPKPTDQEGIIMRNNQHQRCSSESFLLMEEQPSWLEDLLDEPESPLYKGHRRSASDSSAYLDTSVETSFNRRKESVFSNLSTGQQPWSSTQNYANNNTLEAQRCFGGQQQSWASHESSPNSSMNFTTGLPAATRDGAVTLQTSPGSSSCGGPQEDRTGTSTITDQKLDRVASSASQRLKNVGEKGDFSQANNSASRADVKHAKQKTAHRSRVRKLQYIAELERNVQVLQAEGSVVFADIEFLDQHNLILSMENRALRQRLDSLAQEQLIKQLQHEMLERELGRLQALFQLQMQQQQQQQRQRQRQQQRKQQNVKNSRAKSKDFDSQFGNISLINNNEAGADASTDHPRI